MAKEFEFDPVKRDKGGKEAEAVIWSCSVLEKAVDAMKKGLPLKANPFIGKNTKLLKPDLVFNPLYASFMWSSFFLTLNFAYPFIHAEDALSVADIYFVLVG